MNRATINQIVIEAADIVVAEWDSRTWFGKVLFPFTLFLWAYQWFALLVLMVSVVFVSLVVRVVNGSYQKLGEALPNVYKGEG